MIWKNIEIHNAVEIAESDGGAVWKRFPTSVTSAFEKGGLSSSTVSTGVELRFVPLGDEVTIVMECTDPPENEVISTFHVYYGAIQGGWSDHERKMLVTHEPKKFTFKRHPKLETLKRMTDEAGYEFSPEVVRVIFDRGYYRLIDVIGDVRPPREDELPRRRLLFYGSSITHGSNSIDMSHSWVNVTAHNLGCDFRNLGMAGCCAVEPTTIDYIASEGEKGSWDAAVLELGINVLNWDEDKIRERVRYAMTTVAAKNPMKPVIVISPFYNSDDFNALGQSDKWRAIMAEIAGELHFANLRYYSGLDFIDSMADISADLVHPNIYGVQKIAERLTEIIRNAELGGVCFAV